MTDPNLWTGVCREWVKEGTGWKRYPIQPPTEILWQEEWDRMIFGDRETMLSLMRAAVKKTVRGGSGEPSDDCAGSENARNSE